MWVIAPVIRIIAVCVCAVCNAIKLMKIIDLATIGDHIFNEAGRAYENTENLSISHSKGLSALVCFVFKLVIQNDIK